MYTDTKSSINIILLKQPAHAHQHKMKVVNGRALDNPVDPTCYELKFQDNKYTLFIKYFEFEIWL